MGLLDQVLGAVLKQGGQGQNGSGGLGDLLGGLTGPGQTALQRIPWAAYSTAIDWVRLTTPAFAIP